MSDHFTPIVRISLLLSGITAISIGEITNNTLVINRNYGLFLILLAFITYFLPEYWWWTNHTRDRITNIKKYVERNDHKK